MRSIDDFEKVLDYVVGVYYDATNGFVKLRNFFEEKQDRVVQALKNMSPNIKRIADLDPIEFMYGSRPPGETDTIVLHSCTQKEFKDRNSEGGINFQFLGNMALVSLYQYWEDFHREQIAKELGISKCDLVAFIMGDLRLLRNSIIHCSGAEIHYH